LFSKKLNPTYSQVFKIGFLNPILTTHVHDNRGRTDDHLVPFDGTVDWPATFMALFKVGYTGPLVLELPDHGDAQRVLTRAVAAQRRIQAILDDLTQPFAFEEG
jgi:hypothetical protein